MFTVFLDCPNPASTPAKPRCMINTKPVDSIIQMLLAVNSAVAAASAASAAVAATSSNMTSDSIPKLVSIVSIDKRLNKKIELMINNDSYNNI
jgi:hypothetical protein